MKVLLISANKVIEPYPVYPIGLDYVNSAIDKRHDVRIIDVNCCDESFELSAVINEFSPDLIGVAIRNIDNTNKTNPTGFIDGYKDLINKLRTITNCKVVLGGSGFTLFPEELINLLGADYGIIGEGERINLLIEAIEEKIDPVNIPGIIYPGIKKEVPKPLEQITNRKFRKNEYTDFYLKTGGMLNVQTKRGCFCECIYCTYPNIEGRTLRLISPDDVADDALRIQEAGARYIFMSDALFNADYRHNLEVANAFQKKGVSIPWGGYFAPLKPPKDYYNTLSSAGLKHVEFGTESLSAEQLKMYRKPFRQEHVFEAHNDALKAGIHIAHYFILNGPGETINTLDETFSLAVNLQKSVLFFFCGMRIYPGTELFKIAIHEKVIDSSESLLDPVFYQGKTISEERLNEYVIEKSKGHPNWIIGDSHTKTAGMVKWLYNKGKSGPLWERLIR